MTWADDLVAFAQQNVTPQVREALLYRGVSDTQIASFQIGYLDSVLPETVPESFRSWANNKLDDVFVLPLTNTLCEVRGFQFRHVDRSRTGYMDYFVDRKESVLFGLGQAAKHMWETRKVYLVEGAFDLFPVQRAFPAVVATLTAQPNIQAVRVFRRLVRKVWLGYDMDPTGRRGCKEFIDKHGKEFETSTVVYPMVLGSKVKDPGDLWEAWGDQQMGAFIRSATQDDIFG